MAACTEVVLNCWIKRGSHRSVRELVASIRTWIGNWNDDLKPFIWHKTAGEILDSLAAYCRRINDSGHLEEAATRRSFDGDGLVGGGGGLGGGGRRHGDHQERQDEHAVFTSFTFRLSEEDGPRARAPD